MGLVGSVAMRLALIGKLGGCNWLFYVSFLIRYEPGGDGVKPPPPIVVYEEEEYKVEAQLAHQV